MTTTHVQIFATAAPQAVSGPGTAVPAGMEGLFAQLINTAQAAPQPFTADEAANIAQGFSPELAKTLPSDPTALKDLLNGVKQAVDKGNTADVVALLSGTKSPTETPDTTLQNLPTAPVAAPAPVASISMRSRMTTLQPQEVEALLQHETQVLRNLGFENIDLTKGFDPVALNEAYLQAGLTPREAAVRVEVVGQMVEHFRTSPQQPLTLTLPADMQAAAPKAVEPLPPSKQDFLSAIQAAAQTIAPESEDVVTQILSLDSVEGVDEDGDPITKTVNVPLLHNTPVAPQPVLPENEAKAAVQALADLSVPAQKTGMQTRTAQPELEASSQTAEGKIVDNALNQQPAAHLLAAVEHSDTTNGVATQSGAAVSVAAYSQNGSSSFNDGDRRQSAKLEDVDRISADSAMSFDRFLNQKLESAAPLPAAYNAHGKIPTAAEQVSVSVRQLAEAGGGEVRIKLSPEELGRVDIRLEIHNGQVRGVVMVERPEVLNDLARDLKHLQQALSATGLTMADNALSFQMQHQGGDQNQGRERNSNAPLGGVSEVAANDDGSTPFPTGPWRDVTKLVDVNI